MPVEIRMLVYSVVVLFVTIVVAATARMRETGLVALAGNRDGLTEPGTFCKRAQRTAQNHVEGLALFASLALAAVVIDATSPLTALGAKLFFYSRTAHAVLYWLGVPWLRTAVWLVGIAGTAIIGYEILT